MTTPLNQRRLGLIGVLISVLVVVAPAWGQVPDPISNDPNDPAYAGAAPSTRATATTQNLSNTNENADTLQYTDRELGPINLGFDLKGGYTDNLFNSTVSGSGPFAGFSIPVGLRLKNVKTLFNMNYRVDKLFYPSHSEINDFTQIVTLQLDHRSSEHTALYWNLAAGRLTSTGLYLPSIIPIGSGGVAQGPVGALNSSYITSNAATSLGFAHELSENDKVLGTATAGWVEQAQGKAVPGIPRQILRNQIFGLDLQYEHAASLRDTIGVELTNTYIRGLVPSGHDNYTAVEGTYARKLSDHLDFRVTAGPLYSTAATVVGGHNSSFSYAASADLAYGIQHSHMGLGYSRVFEVGYLQTSAVANQFSGFFDRELSRTVDLTVDARYIRTDASSAFLRQSALGISGRVSKRVAPSLLLFVSASRSQQRTPVALINNNSFNRDDVFGGITVLLGNPLYRRGVH